MYSRARKDKAALQLIRSSRYRDNCSDTYKALSQQEEEDGEIHESSLPIAHLILMTVVTPRTSNKTLFFSLLRYTRRQAANRSGLAYRALKPGFHIVYVHLVILIVRGRGGDRTLSQTILQTACMKAENNKSQQQSKMQHPRSLFKGIPGSSHLFAERFSGPESCLKAQRKTCCRVASRKAEVEVFKGPTLDFLFLGCLSSCLKESYVTACVHQKRWQIRQKGEFLG